MPLSHLIKDSMKLSDFIRVKKYRVCHTQLTKGSERFETLVKVFNIYILGILGDTEDFKLREGDFIVCKTENKKNINFLIEIVCEFGECLLSKDKLKLLDKEENFKLPLSFTLRINDRITECIAILGKTCYVEY